MHHKEERTLDLTIDDTRSPSIVDVVDLFVVVKAPSVQSIPIRNQVNMFSLSLQK